MSIRSNLKKIYTKSENNDQIYCFDQIIIHSKQDQQTLKKSLPVKELKSECRQFYFRRPLDNAKRSGYKTAINSIVPTNNFFTILNRYESILGNYKVLKIEIARDIIFNDLSDAYLEFMQSRETNKKWSTYFHAYIQNGKEFKKKDKGLWSDKTNYYGNNSFNFAIYPRTSKINDMPCLHMEFRLLHANKIKKKTGIEFIRDFIDYDIENMFEEFLDKYINYYELDIQKVGKWLLNWTRRKKLTRKEINKAQLRARLFCDIYNISNFADFKCFLGKMKIEAKKKKGRKSAFDNKILSARYDYFLKYIDE